MRQLLRNLSKTAKSAVRQFQSALMCYKIKLLYPSVQLGRNVQFYGPVTLRIDKTATVRIGDNVTFRSTTIHNFVGINRPVSIYVGRNATLDIGTNCGFSGTAIFATTSIIVGPYCIFGGNSSLWDTDFHPLDHQLRRVQLEGAGAAPIRIHQDAFIGANTLVMKGVTIGARAIIGAGAVVTKPIPEDQIWAGNPARFIKQQYQEPVLV